MEVISHVTTLLKQLQNVTLQTNPKDQMHSRIPTAWLLVQYTVS